MTASQQITQILTDLEVVSIDPKKHPTALSLLHSAQASLAGALSKLDGA